eukprot:766801-Hanusia_phi.AAC.2
MAAPMGMRSLSDIIPLPSEERMLALTIANKELDQPVYALLREQCTLVRNLQSSLLSRLWEEISDEDFIKQYLEMEGVYEQIHFLERQLGSVSNSHSIQNIDRSLLDRYDAANYRLRQRQIELRLGSRGLPSSSAQDHSQAAQAVATSLSRSSSMFDLPRESRKGKRSLSLRASEATGDLAAASSSRQRQPTNKRAKGSRVEGSGGSFQGNAPEPSGDESQRRAIRNLKEAVPGQDVAQKSQVLVGEGNATGGGGFHPDEEAVSRAEEVSRPKTRDSNRHKRLPADSPLPGVRESRLNKSYPRRNLTISENKCIDCEPNGTDNKQREQYHLWTKYILQEKKSGDDVSPEVMMGNKRFRKKMEDCYKYQDLLLQIPFSGRWVDEQ